MTLSRKRAQIPQSVRFSVFRRDNFTCVYCGRSSPEVTLHADHARSHKDGGEDIHANLVTACSDCNLGKGSGSVSVRSAGTEREGLVGLFGLWLHEDGKPKSVFRIDSKESDVFLCSFYSALDGRIYECGLRDMGFVRRALLFKTREDADYRSLALSYEITDYQAYLCAEGNFVPSDFNPKWRWGSHEYYVEQNPPTAEDIEVLNAMFDAMKEQNI